MKLTVSAVIVLVSLISLAMAGESPKRPIAIAQEPPIYRMTQEKLEDWLLLNGSPTDDWAVRCRGAKPPCPAPSDLEWHPAQPKD